MIVLVIGSLLGEITGGDTTRFAALAAGTALLVSLIAFIAWLAKAGIMVHFISESVTDRLQIRRGAFPCQHAIAQAFRFS